MIITNNLTCEQFKEYIQNGYYNGESRTSLVSLIKKEQERFKNWFYSEGNLYCNGNHLIFYEALEDFKEIIPSYCYGNSQLKSEQLNHEYAEGIIYNFKDRNYYRHAFNIVDTKVFDYTASSDIKKEHFGEKQFYFGVLIPKTFRKKFYRISGIKQNEIKENKNNYSLLVPYFLKKHNLVSNNDWKNYAFHRE